MPRRIAIVGGGPGGLFLAALLRTRRPDLDVTVLERNGRDDAFGFGVVFSDATLKAIDAADPVLRDGLRDHGEHWDRIEVRQATDDHPEGTVRHGFSGNGMAAIHRRTLLRLLQENAERAGAELRFSTPVPDVGALAASYDLVVGADGTSSTVRAWLSDAVDLGHSVQEATAHFIWFGTTYRFDGLTFLHRASEHGHFAVHGYPISDELGTFIVETDPGTWRRAGMDRFDVTQPPGPSDLETQHYLEKLFADDVDGHGLVANNSRWGRFRTRRTRRWHHVDTAGAVVLLGDAVHTAHFSVGSGTKMAMEDAVTLSEQLAGVDDLGDAAALEAALASYAEQRKRSVGRIQDASVPSLGWWERFGRYRDALDPLTFAFHFFSRSIGVDKIAQRDPDLARDVRAAWLAAHRTPALETPWRADGVALGRRLVVDGRTLVDATSGLRVPATVVTAPEDADDLPAALAALPSAGVVAVTGGTAYTRGVLAEEARLWCGLGAVLVTPADETPDDAALETLLLSARADGVATR
ncbi:FAD-dependent monooxygenase [Nocardioides sp. CFH 31398]|uniref:FAD-dependent monooxygenase n=1 Tax=Nocardioides sp. CFH 31398 TaxID=2919579 RepID=UPI001F053075|nr:FAD-dependent monooxygenase [Nocardioides sp. CFH 31398]MCH1865469.1 FAD-dependent monooxygenase [Nocardioides sp. CFH 31398]